MKSNFKIKRSKIDEFYFTLSASNGEVIATSEMYNSKQAAYAGIKSIKVNARLAGIVDDTKNIKTKEVPVEEIEVVEPVVVPSTTAPIAEEVKPKEDTGTVILGFKKKAAPKKKATTKKKTTPKKK